MKKELVNTSKRIIKAVQEAKKRFLEKAKANGDTIIVSKNGEIVEIDFSKTK